MVTSPALLVVLLVLAVARGTTLVVDDMITDPIRAWVADRASYRSTDPDARDGNAWAWTSYLLGCPWCVSIYVGGALAGLTYAWHAYWPVQVLLLLLASSEVAGLLAVVRNALESDT